MADPLKGIKFLEDIKSIYIKRNIFFYLKEKQKLKILIYNKQLQNICGINIDDYKETSGKYIIFEKNGIGKQYILNTYDMVFEGEYLKGKRNGKGKEYYDNGKLKFEGEYLNDKIWNGKGYDINGDIIFEINDGKGYIKYCDFYGYLIFEGEYIKGERNGKGKEYNYNYEDRVRYEKKNKKKYYNTGTVKFKGEYLNNRKWNGKGYKNGRIIYEINNGKGYIKDYDFYGDLKFGGEYLNGERNGKGKEYDVDGKLKFEGDYFNGKRNGKGKEYYNGKLKFEGEYLNGKRWNGKGKEYDCLILWKRENNFQTITCLFYSKKSKFYNPQRMFFIKESV